MASRDTGFLVRRGPAMRDPDVIDALDALERDARDFDEISREQDAHYSARSFMRWVRLDTTAPKYGERRPLVATAGSNGDGQASTRLPRLSVKPGR